jgi:aminoglycoside N3'-acetyltransferase
MTSIKIEKKKIINLNQYIINHLKELGVKPGDHVLLYSKISSFGILDNNFPKFLLSTILNFIGHEGTLVMPSYAFKNKNYIFNIKRLSNDYNNGTLVKIFFKYKNILRSFRPIHSHFGIGLKSKILINNYSANSFGKDSDFYFFTKNNFKCIYLGCVPNEAATYFMHLEYLHDVPYRRKIIIKKKVYKNNLIKNINVKYFKKIKDVNYDLDNAFEELKRLGAKIIKVKIRFGSSFSINLKDFFKYGNIMFRNNKLCLLKND